MKLHIIFMDRSLVNNKLLIKEALMNSLQTIIPFYVYFTHFSKMSHLGVNLGVFIKEHGPIPYIEIRGTLMKSINFSINYYPNFIKMENFHQYLLTWQHSKFPNLDN